MSDDAWDCTACARPARRGNRLRPRLKRGDASVTTHRGSSRRLRHWDVSMLQCRSTQVDLDRCCHQSEASLTVPMRAFDFQRAALHACRNCRIFSVPPCMRAGIAGPRVHSRARARAHTHTHVRSRTPPHTRDTQITHHPLFRCISTFHRQSRISSCRCPRLGVHDAALAQTPALTLPHMHSHAQQATDACTYSAFMRD